MGSRGEGEGAFALIIIFVLIIGALLGSYFHSQGYNIPFIGEKSEEEEQPIIGDITIAGYPRTMKPATIYDVQVDVNVNQEATIILKEDMSVSGPPLTTTKTVQTAGRYTIDFSTPDEERLIINHDNENNPIYRDNGEIIAQLYKDGIIDESSVKVSLKYENN